MSEHRDDREFLDAVAETFGPELARVVAEQLSQTRPLRPPAAEGETAP